MTLKTIDNFLGEILTFGFLMAIFIILGRGHEASTQVWMK